LQEEEGESEIKKTKNSNNHCCLDDSTALTTIIDLLNKNDEFLQTKVVPQA
jgi:hypothetical protein